MPPSAQRGGTRCGDPQPLRVPGDRRYGPPSSARRGGPPGPDGYRSAPPPPGFPEGVNSLEISARLLEAEGYLEGRRDFFFLFSWEWGGDANKITRRLRRRQKNNEEIEEIYRRRERAEHQAMALRGAGRRQAQPDSGTDSPGTARSAPAAPTKLHGPAGPRARNDPCGAAEPIST